MLIGTLVFYHDLTEAPSLMGVFHYLLLFYRCDSLLKLKSKLETLRGYLKDSSNFKKIYRYAFDFCRVRNKCLILAYIPCKYLYLLTAWFNIHLKITSMLFVGKRSAEFGYWHWQSNAELTSARHLATNRFISWVYECKKTPYIVIHCCDDANTSYGMLIIEMNAIPIHC